MPITTTNAPTKAATVYGSARANQLEPLLTIAQVADLLTERTSLSAAKNSMSAPDLVQPALDKAQVPAAQAFMLGDTAYDSAAAGKVGINSAT